MPDRSFYVRPLLGAMLIANLAACSGGGGAPAVRYAPSAVDTAQPASTGTPTATAPTATPTPSATATPEFTTAPANTAYDPPAGTYPYFPSSVFLQPLSNPSPNPSSSAWISKISPIQFSEFQFAANSSGTTGDYGFPIYNNANSGTPYKVHCTANFGGTCSLEGKTVNILPGMYPESGNATGCKGDCHMGFIAGNDEYDLWATQWPPSGTTINIGWGGACSLAGPGYSSAAGMSCASTSTGTALSQGIIRPTDWLAAAVDGGTLPYALQVAVKCSDGRIAPFTGSDGKCAGGVPQGTRGYLAMHDADVNGTAGLSPLAKALLRTIDEDHYGVIVTDTNGGESGFSFAFENDLTYTALGLPGPWVASFVPEAEAEGFGVSESSNIDYVTIPFAGIDFDSEIKFT